MQMYAPPGVNAVTSATTGQPYAVAPGGVINALVQDVPDLLSRGFTLQRMPFVLALSGTPVILPSSGSSNASGQITLTTALPYTPSGTVQVYLPAGVVTAGSQGSGAGLYLANFSSTTVCQLTGTGIVTANGAYTQTTSAVTVFSAVVPGGALGPNGSLRWSHHGSIANNANNKSWGYFYGGQGTLSGGLVTTTADYGMTGRMINRGSSGQQIYFIDGYAAGNGANGKQIGATDSTQSQTFSLTHTLSVATDYMILDAITLEVLPG